MLILDGELLHQITKVAMNSVWVLKPIKLQMRGGAKHLKLNGTSKWSKQHLSLYEGYLVIYIRLQRIVLGGGVGL